MENKQHVLEFMNALCEIKKSKRTYWYNTTEIKNLIETWIDNKYGHRPYVKRTTCIDIAVSLKPNVNIKEIKDMPLIGLNIPKSVFSNIFHNIHNNKAIDIQDAQIAWWKYPLEMQKKIKNNY